MILPKFSPQMESRVAAQMMANHDTPRITPGWSTVRREYTCRDGKRVEVQCGTVEQNCPRNLVKYARNKSQRLHSSVTVSGTQFCRDMAEIFGSPDAIRTMTFPVTIRTVHDYTFDEAKRLRSMVLNDGLRVLGKR